MLLCQRGLLDLDTPLGELLPGFVVGRAAAEHARQVKLRHLLAHNSGLPGYVEFFRTATTPVRAVSRLPGTAPRSRAGDARRVLRPGLHSAGQGAGGTDARVPGQPGFGREIFQPLGMVATGFCPAPDARPSIPPTEEDTTLRHRRIQGEVQDEHAWLLKGAGGHAGLFSNVPGPAALCRRDSQCRAHSGVRNRNAPPVRRNHGRAFCRSGRARRAARARSAGIRPQRSPPPAVIFRPAPSGILASAVARFGSTWTPRLPWCCSPTAPGPTGGTASQLIREVRPAFHDAVREAL